jgi:hypothetical protein
MRKKIIETVNSLETKVDSVFLGYATCQSLAGIADELKVPVSMLSGSDCIEALLGTDDYDREKKICTGTWFSSPGWATEGRGGLVKELHLDSVEGVDPSFFMDILFASYERCLFIDPGIGNTEEFRSKSEIFASELGLRHDCRTCGTDGILKAFLKAKELANV